jgi:autotransporter-associated beta strand protein
VGWSESPIYRGETAIGSFSNQVSGLTAGQEYWYRCFASNGVAPDAWADATNFIPPPPVTYTWDAGGANNNWSTGGNWDPGDTVPTAGDNALFTGASNRTVTIGTGDRNIFSANVTGSANWTFANNASDVLNVGSNFTYGSGGTSEYQSVMAGVGGVTVTNGIFRLTGTANTYSGPTTVEGGTLRFGGAVPVSGNSALGNAASDIQVGGGDGSSDAALIFYNGGYALTIARRVVVAAGSGSRTVGSISTGASRAIWTNIVLNKSATVIGSDGYLTYFKGISGVGGIVCDSDPARKGLQLQLTSSYTGTTVVKSGTALWEGSVTNDTDGALGRASSAVEIGGGDGSADAKLVGDNANRYFVRDLTVVAGSGARSFGGDWQFSGVTCSGTVTLNKDLTIVASPGATGGTLYPYKFTGKIQGAGGLTVDGTNMYVYLQGAVANTYAGTTRVNSARLYLEKSEGVVAVPGNLVVGDGSGTDIVLVNQAGQIAQGVSITINSNGVFDVSSASYALTNTFLGTGVIVTGTKTNIVAEGGVLSPGPSGGIGTLSVSNNLDFRGSYTFEYNAWGDVAVPGINSDLMAATNLVFGGTSVPKSVNLVWLGAGGAGVGDYVLFSYGGSDPAIVPADWTVSPLAGMAPGVVWLDSAGKKVMLTLRRPAGTVLLIR